MGTWQFTEGPRGCARHTELEVGWNRYRGRSRTRGPTSQVPVRWRVAAPREDVGAPHQPQHLAMPTPPTMVSHFVLSMWVTHGVVLGGSASSQCCEGKYAFLLVGWASAWLSQTSDPPGAGAGQLLRAPSERVTKRAHSHVRATRGGTVVPRSLCVGLCPRPSALRALGCGRAAPVPRLSSRRAGIGAGSASSRIACQHRAHAPRVQASPAGHPWASVGVFILAHPLHVLPSYESTVWKACNGPVSAVSSGLLPVIPRNPFLRFLGSHAPLP